MRELQHPTKSILQGGACSPSVASGKLFAILVVVASALPFRADTVPFAVIADHRSAIVNLLAGNLIGAWFAAG